MPQVMKILNRLYFDKIVFDPEVEVGCIPYLVRKSKVLDCDSTKTCYYFIKTVYGDRYIYIYIYSARNNDNNMTKITLNDT